MIVSLVVGHFLITIVKFAVVVDSSDEKELLVFFRPF